MKILVEIESHALGDSVGAVAVISKYQKENNYEVSVICSNHNLFIQSYPNLKFIGRDEPITDFYNDKINTTYKFDVPLLEGYANDFGITAEGITLKVDPVNGQRPIKNKYVCIGVHSTAQCKYWNYPGGWDILCKMLRKKGLTPVVVERDELFGIEGHMNGLPQSAVKKIGMKFSDVLN